LTKTSDLEIQSINFEYIRGERYFVPTTTIYNKYTVPNWDGSDNELMDSTESGKDKITREIYRYKEIMDECATPLKYTNKKLLEYVDDHLYSQSWYITLSKTNQEFPRVDVTLILTSAVSDTVDSSKPYITRFFKTIGIDRDIEIPSLENKLSVDRFKYYRKFDNYQPFGLTSEFSKRMIQTVDGTNPAKNVSITDESLLNFLSNAPKMTGGEKKDPSEIVKEKFFDQYVDKIPEFFKEHYSKKWEEVQNGITDKSKNYQYVVKKEDADSVLRDIVSNIFPDFLEIFDEVYEPQKKGFVITSSMIEPGAGFIDWKGEFMYLVKDLDLLDPKQWIKQIASKLGIYAFLPSYGLKNWGKSFSSLVSKVNKAIDYINKSAEAAIEDIKSVDNNITYIKELYEDFWDKVVDEINKKGSYTITVDDLIEGHMRFLKSVKGTIPENLRESTEKFFKESGFTTRTLNKIGWETWRNIGELEIKNGMMPITGSPIREMDLIRSFQFVPPKSVTYYYESEEEMKKNIKNN
jgi:Ca2+-binding EF-hand superfamily protein